MEATTFRQLTPLRWSFFHNSFRQFVLARTSVDPFGQPDAAASVGLHQRIAAIAGQPNSPDELKWQELYHLEQAGELQALLDQSQQQLFRAQYLSGPPIWEIREDIHRGLKAAAELGNGLPICRLLLIESELDDRNDVLSETDFKAALLDLTEPAELGGLILPADELLVSDALALQWSARLSDSHSEGLGRKLFEAAEPMNILAGVERVSALQDQSVDEWARVAWRFRPLDKIIAAIENIKADAHMSRNVAGDDDYQADAEARLKLLIELGAGIQDAQDEAAYGELSTLLEASELGQLALLRLAFRSARLMVAGTATIGDPVAAMKKVLAAAPPKTLSEDEAAYFADVLAQIPALCDRADDYLASCPAPLAVRELRDPGEKAFVPVEPLFRQARARAARGRPLDPTAILPAKEHWDEARLARSDIDPHLVERAAGTVLRLLPQLFDTNRGRGVSDATGELVEALAQKWPASALTAAEWMLHEGSADRATVISALLAAELRSSVESRVAQTSAIHVAP